MTRFLDGLRVTARTLSKQPVFTTVVILSLALAIALNTTMYSVLDAMTHPRLDMRNPDRLYWIRFFGDYKLRVDHKSRDAALASGMHSYEAITRSTTVGGRSWAHRARSELCRGRRGDRRRELLRRAGIACPGRPNVHSDRRRLAERHRS